GSGKSTLLTIAGSLEEPSSGEGRVCGQDLTTMPRNAKARLRRRTIGFVLQDFNLLPGLTAAENVALPLELDGMSARKARVVGLKALDELGRARLGQRRGGHAHDPRRLQAGRGRRRGDPRRAAGLVGGPGGLPPGRPGDRPHRPAPGSGVPARAGAGPMSTAVLEKPAVVRAAG